MLMYRGVEFTLLAWVWVPAPHPQAQGTAVGRLVFHLAAGAAEWLPPASAC